MSGGLDEMVDGSGRLRPAWRGLLGLFSALPEGGLEERALRLDRLAEEEGAAGLLAGGAPRRARRLDPVPFLLDPEEFAALEAGLAQRARLLEAVLSDLYGPQALIASGALPPEIVFASPDFLRPLRGHPAGRFLDAVSAELARGPDGIWRVVSDDLSGPQGVAAALTHRARLARALPEWGRALPTRPLRPFVEAWRDALQAEAGGEGAVALLTPGAGHPTWGEHVTLARELGLVLAEPGDLTARGGALWLKTLRGLRPVRVVLRRVPGRVLDPLELGGRPSGGVAGLLDAGRDGAVRVTNHPGAELAESPLLPAFLPGLCERLLGEPSSLPSAETLWLGEAEARARVSAEPGCWRLRPAAGGEAAAALPAGADPRLWAAAERLEPSLAPCWGDGGLEPRPVLLRLFLLRGEAGWRAMPGGLARVPGGPAKDVWVLAEERAEIRGADAQPLAPLAIRRASGDLPSRVADDLYWLGRYVERLDDAARLARAALARLERSPLLPRDAAELEALGRCLAEAKLIPAEDAPRAGREAAARDALLRAGREGGRLHRLSGAVLGLVEATRDRMTGDMHAAFTLPLRDARAALDAARALPALGAGLGALVRYAAGVAGVAAENMVRGGAHAFLDLGRRVERAGRVSAFLGRVLDEPPARVEGSLVLALELCDSVITYRTRYLHVLQPAPALDLVLADPGNPRGLAFQLDAAAGLLAGVEGAETPLSATARRLGAEAAAMAGGVGGAAAAVALSPRLLALSREVWTLSDAIGRRYFTLVSAPRLVGEGPDTSWRGAA